LGELARAGLALRVEHAVVREAELRVAGRRRRVALPRPAVVVRREAFDADLVSQIRARGIEVHDGLALTGLRGNRAETTGGDITFAALICADGVAGPSRRLLGFPAGRRSPLREVVAEGRGQERLVFDLDAPGSGYAWRFPCLVEGAPSESCGIYRPAPPGDAGADLAAWAGTEGLGLGSPQAWSIRPALRGGPVGQGAALLAGEALGIDPLAGEGIRYALWSGRLAGRTAGAALAAGRTPDPEGYRRRLTLSRSGLVLALSVRLASRLHGPNPGRWRRLAARRPVAEVVAALVSL
jgi:flavin-dependent dehydrogenase